MIDLSMLPAPQVIEELEFETILSELLADFISRRPDYSAIVESDPIYKLAESFAYRELLLRQRVNEGAKSVMLAYATSADLDNLSANNHTERQVIQEGDDSTVPPTPATLEDDDSLKTRAQLAWEGLSVAGPTGAYKYHALSADGKVKDACATSPEPGHVTVAILSHENDGTATDELIATVDAHLNDEERRPITDQVKVVSAEILNYEIKANLTFFSGPDQEVVFKNAQAAVDTYQTAQHKIGRDITLSGIYACLHQPGVQNVELLSPTKDLVVSKTQAAYCLNTELTMGGIDE